MRKAQVFLREDQKTALRDLSRRTGRKQSELIRHGVDLAIAEVETRATEPIDTSKQEGAWKQAWLAAAGIWADRTDLDELYANIRKGDRSERLEKQWRDK